MTGLRLLAEINILRMTLGNELLGRIKIASSPRHSGACTIAQSAGCGVSQLRIPGTKIATCWPGRLTLKFFREEITEQVGRALSRPFSTDKCEVLATGAMDSFTIAAAFGLVFVSHDEFLDGWIDPSNTDPALWELHLMPGRRYPPGHEPHGHTECSP